MESSATKAIYTGAYVFVFVSSLTITLFLFNSILDFSNQAYEFETMHVNNQVIINAPVEAERLLTSDEVASYYYNYIKKDQYAENISGKYKVEINVNGINSNSNLTYKDLIGKLGANNKYILRYEEQDGSGVATIKIIKATDAQIAAMQ